jgi:signal peptidase I
MTVAVGLAVAVAVLAAAIGSVSVARRRYLLVTVRGPSMEPTLRDGDRVLVRRSGLHRISAGDLVVFEEGARSGRRPRPQWVIKRVRAGPGDRVPTTDVPALAGVDHDVVPATSLVVLGDNAARSHDSRAYGYLDGSRVFGVVLRRQGPRW